MLCKIINFIKGWLGKFRRPAPYTHEEAKWLRYECRRICSEAADRLGMAMEACTKETVEKK